MKKHKMSEIQALNSFSFESEGLALRSRRLSKTSHQLVKPRKCISPVPRMDEQKPTNNVVIYKKHLDAGKHLVRL